MKSALAVILLAWNLWLLAAWTGRFHIDPRDIGEALAHNFPPGGFSPGTLLRTWGAFAVAAVGFAGILALAGEAGRAAGKVLARRTRSGLEAFLVRLGVGFGIAGSAILALGLVGLLFAPPRAAAVAVLGLLAAARLAWRGRWSGRPARPFGRNLVPSLTPVSRLALGVAGLVTLMALVNVEMGWDALTYHLRIPSFYIYRHRIYDVWHHYCSVFPSHVEMIYALGLLLGGETLVRIMNFAFGAGLLGVAAALARRLGASPGWAVLITLACPTFLNLTTRSYIDLGFAFYSALSVLVFLRWWRTGSFSSLAASGLLAGWAMGSKYVGVLVGVAVLAAVFPRLKDAAGRRAAALWAVAALAPLLPWLARNWLIRGNPVAPFLGGLFGVPAEVPAEFATIFSGSSPLGALASSLTVRVQALLFDFGAINGPLAPVIAGFLPAVAVQSCTGPGGVLKRAALGYAAGWFVLCPDARFFLPVLPVLAALYSFLFGEAARLGGLARSGARVLLEASLVLGLAYSAGIQWIFYAPASISLGFESAAAKLERMLPPPPFTAQLKDFINANLGPRERILYLCHFNTYHVERECLADFHFGTAHVTRIIRKGRTASGMDRELKRRGIRWLLSTGTGAAQYAGIPGFFDVPPRGWREFKEMLCTYGQVSWQSDEYTLYRLGSRHPWQRLPAFPVYEALVFREADRALAQGRFREALAEYLSPPDLLEEVGSTFVRRGDALRGLGEHGRAARAYEKALDLGVQSSRLHLGLALALLHQRNPGEALLHAQAAWGRNPRSAHAAATLAGIYATMGDEAPARRWMGRAIELDPGLEGYREMARKIDARFSP